MIASSLLVGSKLVGLSIGKLTIYRFDECELE